MRALLTLLIGCALFSSCSFSGYGYRYGNPDLLKMGEEASLYTIRIEQWGKIRFAGLLALQSRQEGLYYMLLDATGVKLIEAEVSLSGGHRLVRANGPLQTSQLPHYLSTALKRIYLLVPRQSPCSDGFLLWFCKEVLEERGWRKYVQAGPFTVWEAENNERDNEKEETTTYSQPWLGVRIILGDLVPPDEMSS